MCLFIRLPERYALFSFIASLIVLTTSDATGAIAGYFSCVIPASDVSVSVLGDALENFS